MAERHRRTATVRFRVTALALIASSILLALTSVTLVIHQRRALTESLEEALTLEIHDLEVAADDGETTLDGVIDDDGVAQIVRGTTVVASTPNIAGRGPLAPAPLGARQLRNVEQVLRGEREFRVLSVRHGDETIHLGASLEDIDDVTESLVTALAIGAPIVLGALGLLVWLLVGRTLAPVEAIRSQVATIGGSELHRRVPEPATDDEIARLAQTMNAMLDRLEDAAARQQQFVADASHELRSPLTRIRSEVEADLTDLERADPVATLRSVLEEAGDLERLVDDLLHLARSEAGAVTQQHAPVDLDDIVLRHVEGIRARSPVAVDATGVSGAQVHGDGRQLSRAVGNLLENAVRHADTTITVTLAERDDAAVLTIADDGPGIARDQRERIFERFTRVDGARTRGAGGTGLGLSITRDIVERHEGTVEVDADHTSGARFVVRLPLVR